jgi:hypothetical protein
MDTVVRFDHGSLVLEEGGKPIKTLRSS